MHRIIPLALCVGAAFAQEDRAPDLAWLAGHWTGTTGSARAEEVWLPPAGGMLLGMGRVTSGERVFFEYLRVVRKPDGVFYVAQPAGRPPTEFKLTRFDSKSARFENPAHDFPKIITYESPSPDTLVAVTEGEVNGKNQKQEFRFRRAAVATPAP